MKVVCRRLVYATFTP
ncbi:hypothetical protein K6U52_04705 [Vibrio vulnificus]|nr:hypothetical protein [Vibrio vulnificus]